MKNLTLVLFSLALLAAPAAADERATVPYSALLKAARIDTSDIEGVGARVIQFSVRSKLPNVKPDDIKLKLTVADRSVPIEISMDGTFDLPISAFLVSAGARLTTDQPQKTVGFVVSTRWERDIEFDAIDDGARVRYATLFPSDKMMKRARDVVAQLQGDQGLNSVRATPTENVRSVIFELEDPEILSSVVLDFGDRDMDLDIIGKGRYRIVYRADWARFNPWIKMTPAEPWMLRYDSVPAERSRAEP